MDGHLAWHDTNGMAHHYLVTCHWEGSTAGGYSAYDRTHSVRLPPAEEVLSVSADQAFLGDGRLVNPESLLVAAAVSCQLLSFLAVAARARIVVTAYDDEARAVMEGDPPRITEISLHPRITVEPPTTVERVLHLAEVAHRECYVANSLTARVTVEPEVIAGRAAPG
jgi:organic hydroperoxide reductase OsmC/OhrA